jgi:hypothetical protein
MDGLFNGKIIKNIDSPKSEVQYGPLVIPKIEDPLDKLAKATMGAFPYEANGVVEWRPENIQFLGS